MRPGIPLLLLAAVSALLGCVSTRKLTDIPIAGLCAPEGASARYRLVGSLGVPMGECVTVQGVAMTQRLKAETGVPFLRVESVNGRPLRGKAVVRLRPWFSDWSALPHGTDTDVPRPQPGRFYTMKGYGSGAYVGIPSEVMTETGVIPQTTAFYFREEFVVYASAETPPADVGR